MQTQLAIEKNFYESKKRYKTGHIMMLSFTTLTLSLELVSIIISVSIPNMHYILHGRAVLVKH